MKNNKIIIACVLVAFVALVLLICKAVSGDKVSSLEELKIREVSKDVINYTSSFSKKNPDDDKYISTAVEYYIGHEKNEIDAKDVYDFIKSHFKTKLSLEKIQNIGIVSYLVDKNVVYDFENNKYLNKNKPTQSDIAETPVNYYVINNIKKEKNNSYIVKYDKYVIKNPYDIFNYYNDMKDKKDAYINEYLTGDKNIGVIYDFLTDDIVKEIGEQKGSVEVTYIVDSDKLLIDSIKE